MWRSVPTGTLLALGSGDGLVRFWDIQNGNLVQSASAHQGGVTDLAFSPDGQSLASDSYDSHIMLWQVSNGNLLKDIAGTSGALASIAFAPSGTDLATGALDGAVQIWAVAGLVSPRGPGLAAPQAQQCTDVAAFIADVTIPDNTQIGPGAPFDKTWRLQNNGTCAWGSGYTLVFVGGSQMGAPNAINVPSVQPGGQVDLTIPMAAPVNPGAFQGVWQLVNPSGQSFGPQLTVVIQVPPPAPPPPALGITASSTNINAGDSVTIQASVQNVQAAWVNGEALVNNFFEQTYQLCSTTTFTLDALLPNGQHQYQSVTVNVNGNCNNNNSDLEIRSYSVDNSNPQAGQTVRFHLRIKNDGGSQATGFDVIWRPTGSSGYRTVASNLDLNSGDETTIDWNWTYNDRAASRRRCGWIRTIRIEARP